MESHRHSSDMAYVTHRKHWCMEPDVATVSWRYGLAAHKLCWAAKISVPIQVASEMIPVLYFPRPSLENESKAILKPEIIGNFKLKK
ncbi:hypothetical protein HAX54_046859, partial [Datura stramonium]|nr:hypothetical protein [Datura stramonium]